MRNDLKELVLKFKRKNDLQSLKRMAEDNPKNEAILMAYASLAKINYKYEEAADVLYEVIAMGGHQKDSACLELARIYRKQKEYRLAKQALEGIKNPCLVGDIAIEMTNILLAQSSYKEAEEFLDKLKGMNFFSNQYHESMGKLEYNRGNFQEAKNHFDESADLPGSKIRKVLTELKLGNFNQALTDTKRLNNARFKNVSIYLEGCIFIKMQKPNEALLKFKELIGTSYHYIALLKIAYIYANQRKYKEAIDILNRIYSDKNVNANDNTEAYNRSVILFLIMAYVKTSQFDKAASIIENEKMLNPNRFNHIYKVYSYCCRKANRSMVFTLPDEELTYAGYQSAKYSKEAAYRHIKRRHLEANEFDGTKFTDDNIDELWNYAIKNMKQDVRTDYLGFGDVYCISCPNAGVNGEDSIAVVANPSSDEIITIYPVFRNKYILLGDREEELEISRDDFDYDDTDIYEMESERIRKI